MKKSIFLLCLIIGLSACSRYENLFDSSRVEEEAKKNFPVQNVDPNHSWTMMEVRTLDVTVNETSGENYTIKLYTDNPINAVNNAVLLAKTTVANGRRTSISFDAPSAMQYIYVVMEDQKFNRSMKPIDISTKAEVVFGLQDESGRSVSSRNSVVTYEEPDLNDRNLFPTTVPEGIGVFNQSSFSPNTSYKVTNATTSIDLGGNANITLYVSADITLSRLYLTSGSKLFILPGVQVLVKAKPDLGQGNCYITTGVGSLFKVEGQVLQMSSNYKFYNLGSIDAPSVIVDNSAFLYNAGKITTGSISGENKTSKIVNAGILNASSLATRGDSDFLNEGETYVTGSTVINSSSCGWENDGTYNTESISIESTSTRVQNNCKLIVKKDFRMATASGAIFTNNGGAYTECASAYLDNAIIKLGAKAFFKVIGTVDLKYGNRIEGVGQDWALFMASKANQPSGHMWSVTYARNLLMACDDHFAPDQDESNKGSEYKIEGAAQQVGTKNTTIDIPSSECNPGVSNKPGDDTSDKAIEYTYAFEDMTTEAGDFDYNDVVLRVSAPKDGKITVTLVAAGASRNLKIGYNLGSGVSGNLFGGKEVHQILEQTEGSLINTGAGSTATPKSEDITVPANFSLTANGDIFIIDDKGIEVHVREFQQTVVPYGLRIPSGWKYPSERSSIAKAYPPFEEWAKDQNKNMNWYLEENAKTEFIYNK